MAVSYKESGVDIDAGDSLVERIKPLARATYTPLVLDGVGGFASLHGLPNDIEDPILVSGTDGVGTKLKVAFATGRHDTIGQDLVAMCVNDVVTTGARPLFFLDYFASGKLDVGVGEQVVKGIADGCRLAGCALIGGETAELPGMYADGEYDLAGFAVGVVGRKAVLTKASVRPGDEIVAVASSGLHSNGYSLARHVLLDRMKLSLDGVQPELGRTLGEALLTPTRIYARAVQALAAACEGGLRTLCHVTGGGIGGNLPRVMPRGTVAHVRLGHERPAIFELIARGGPVEEAEMRRTFNLGVGLIAIVAEGRAARAVQALTEAGEKAWLCGEVAAADPAAAPEVVFE